MMQKRTIYSLLLISFILVFAFSNAVSQSVTFESKTVARCESTVLNVTVDNPTDVSAVEIVFEVSSTGGGAFFDALSINWDAGFSSLTNRLVDLSGVDNVSPDTVRVLALLTDANDACLAGGSTVVAQVAFTTSNSCSGEVTLDGAVFSCPNFDVSTQFVDCADNSIIPAAVTAGVVTVVNNAPSIASISDATIHWGDTYVGNAVGDDADLAFGCENLTYSKVSGPADLTVNASTGTINWPTTGADICEHSVEIQVEDACGASASTSFTICVQNDAPVITCPADTMIALGDELTASISGTDPDGGPAALLYSLVSFDGPGSASVSPSGVFSWQTLLEESYKGIFTATVAVSDGANVCDPCSPSNADTCSFQITVVNFLIAIQKTHNTPQGQETTVEITMQDSNFENFPMGGFDFLIKYDASALSFQNADAGQFWYDCEWEYFTYRYGPSGNCGGSACPSGFLRVVAIAETNNGPIHPSCFTNTNPNVSNQLVVLHFLVTSDQTFECMYAPVSFYWYDCGDNTISSQDGNQLFISNHVYNFEDTTGQFSIDIAKDTTFPSPHGANSSCDIAMEDGKPDPLRFIDFVNGGVDIICADSIDARGDVNLNEIAYEIADAVVFSNYFVYGISAFTTSSPEGQIAATDVNADGLTLSVADLVYLIRVIIGDASPYPKVITPGEADFIHTDGGSIAVKGDLRIGAAHVVVEGNAVPQLKAENMDIKYNFDGANTRILVYSLEGESFNGEFLNVANEIISIEMADFEGNPIVAKWIPDKFALAQNYPNPFNPTTTVSFTLPVTTDYKLNIFNVNGQRVAAFTGAHEAGLVEIEWDASHNASGVYFYKLQAGSFSDTKKMVLLK
ncbi:MAG: T9SS type A sorting domain-containing protein [Candidatus Zixiibacteriota bacterium]